MFTLDELAALREQDADALAGTLLPIEAGLVGWPVLHLDELEANAVAHGRVVRVDAKAGRCRAEAPSGRLLAIGEVDVTGAFIVLRGFVTSNPL